MTLWFTTDLVADTRIHNPPPTCPKCGSHRTEVVGRSDDGRTLTVRCNSCGERSTRVVETNTSGEDMTKELEEIRGWSASRFEVRREPVAACRIQY